MIFVVDANDRDRIDEVKFELRRAMSEDELRDAVPSVVGNTRSLPACALLLACRLTGAARDLQQAGPAQRDVRGRGHGERLPACLRRLLSSGHKRPTMALDVQAKLELDTSPIKEHVWHVQVCWAIARTALQRPSKWCTSLVFPCLLLGIILTLGAEHMRHDRDCASGVMQAGLCKRDCASGIAQVGLCKQDCASGIAQAGLSKWDCASRIAQVGLRKRDCASGIVQAGLRKWDCASGTAQVGLRKRATTCAPWVRLCAGGTAVANAQAIAGRGYGPVAANSRTHAAL